VLATAGTYSGPGGRAEGNTGVSPCQLIAWLATPYADSWTAATEIVSPDRSVTTRSLSTGAISSAIGTSSARLSPNISSAVTRRSPFSMAPAVC